MIKQLKKKVQNLSAFIHIDWGKGNDQQETKEIEQSTDAVASQTHSYGTTRS
jgi:hypothetical protein